MGKKITNWLKEYKSTLACVYCGISHPALIDFHHNDPELKNNNISSLKSKDEIMKEIKNCTTVCANCHRKLHSGVILCLTKIQKKEKSIPKNITNHGIKIIDKKDWNKSGKEKKI